jgi:FKBP-type peptidyl-prolyl cis-trans isomerase 2
MAKKSSAKKSDEKPEDAAVETKSEESAAPADTTPIPDPNAALEARKKELAGQEVKEGDMIKIDVFGKTIEDDPKNNVVFQVSNQEDAKLLRSYDPQKSNQYTPDIAIVGKKGFLMEKLDEAVKGMKFNEDKIIQLEAKDAFGERDGKKIEMINAKQFKKDMNEDPQPGAQYKDKKGRTGTVIKMGQGRLIVDFNHPLAGRKVEYRLRVLDRYDNADQKVKGLIERRLPGAMTDLFVISHDEAKKVMDIEIPQAYIFQQQLIYFKFGLSMDLQEHIPNVETVRFIEKFEKMPGMAHDHDHDHDHDHEHEHADEKKEEPKAEDAPKAE